MVEFLVQALAVFVALFAIMDPFAGVPMFLALTKRFSRAERLRAARQAVLVAAVPFVVFAVSGTLVLDVLGISLDSFRVAGGIVLLILGLQLVLNFSVSHEKHDVSTASTVIGVPLITGPGVITYAILSSSQSGVLPVLAGGSVALALSWVVLRFADVLRERVGKSGLEVFSRVMGLLLTGIAVELIRTGFLGA